MNLLIKLKDAYGYRMIANVEGEVNINSMNDLGFECIGGAYNLSEIEMLKTDNTIHTEFFMEMLNSSDDENVFELSEDGWLVNLTLLSKSKGGDMKENVDYESMDTFFQILADIKSLSEELVDFFENSSVRKKEEYRKIIANHLRESRNDICHVIDLTIELNLTKMWGD